MHLVAILQTDCPTCRLIAPYLNVLSDSTAVKGVSQDGEDATREFIRQMEIRFTVERDPEFEVSKKFSVVTVPTLYVLDDQEHIVRQEPGFDKTALNEIAACSGFRRLPVLTTAHLLQSLDAVLDISKHRQKTPRPSR